MVYSKNSVAGSVKGYSFKKWLKGTKESFKLVITASIGIGIYYLGVTTLPSGLREVLALFIMAGSKWLMDFIDFYVSDVEL